MKILIRIFVAIILVYCTYLFLAVFIGVGMGSDMGSLKFLVPVAGAMIFAIVGLFYSENLNKNVIIGVVIPVLLILLTTLWNQSAIRNQEDKKALYDSEHCISNGKIDRPGYYYYKCDDGTLYVPEEFTSQFLNDKDRFK